MHQQQLTAMFPKAKSALIHCDRYKFNLPATMTGHCLLERAESSSWCGGYIKIGEVIETCGPEGVSS